MREYIRKTKWGTVKGEELPDGVIYHGIPYAKAERFAYPEMIQSWDGVFDATKPGVECCQYGQYRDESTEEDNFYYREFRRGMKFTYAESPMTLNIIAPKEAKSCPVLVFIHGGGFETGTVEEPPYGTSLEYAKRGILLVSLGYRLNVFSLYRSRNYGLHDQMMGLHWVKEYIEDFGGDPDRIVMMGQSAGAMSVMDLCYSDGLKGVVKGAIMMSGGGVMPKLTAPWTQEESKEFWDRVMKRAGAADEAEMKVLPPEVLWEAWYQESREHYNLHVVQPGIDGTVIPELPSNRKRSGKILNIPMIVGITSQDFMPVVIYEMAYGLAKWSSRKSREPVYGYLFDRTLPGNCFKAYHACDLWYLFGNMDLSWRPFEKADYELAAQMMDYVANFVRCGNPNGEGLPEWKAVTKKHRGFRLFDGVSEGDIGPWGCRRKMLRTQFLEKGPM